MSAPVETTAATTAKQPETQAKGRPHSRNKKSDPFWNLSEDALKMPVQPSPSTNEVSGTSQSESLIADLILTPINVISFILSLLVVERQQRQWRLSQHAPRHEASTWAQFGFHNPEPYQESTETTWHPRLSWKRRGIAKQQMRDVFDMRGRVILALVAWTLLGIVAVAYAFRRMYQWALA
ncbi:hypothetical protein M409DRAFT_52910 [Zasmidium cellare ATCC 36951]|uniref:Uncharacterized protein n=1 Tax=Zasmidium cellare ATCC 36951 TaxID=1080233 RepID=A0A6A6CTX1_ZASCE|nr:uncharacterized protein M409DRAFT_52910 [Zasmidium cellare ATCC 36951]KAF2168926.1 hypothetical protein M409DRAFT_52910 [Zasmidium cellare ATCC 36951]